MFAAAGITLGAAACSTSTGTATSGGALSYDRVRSTALDLFKTKSSTCPFGLDLGKALTGAGITGAVAPAVTDGRSVRGNAGNGLPAQPWRDLALPLAQDTRNADPDPALAGEPLRKAAESLAAQLH
ncbi:hypothetical protein ACWC9T_01110 [Kitasatospora sp. NPDC001159]